MAHPPQVSDSGQPAGEAGPSPPASPPANGPKALQLGGGVPVGLFASAGVDDGGDGGLVAGGDRLTEGEQDAGPRGGGQSRGTGRLGGLAVLVWCGQGQQWRRVGLVQGGLGWLPQLDLGWGPGDASSDIDRLGCGHGGGAEGAGLLLHLGGHRGLQD